MYADLGFIRGGHTYTYIYIYMYIMVVWCCMVLSRIHIGTLGAKPSRSRAQVS